MTESKDSEESAEEENRAIPELFKTDIASRTILSSSERSMPGGFFCRAPGARRVPSRSFLLTYFQRRRMISRMKTRDIEGCSSAQARGLRVGRIPAFAAILVVALGAGLFSQYDVPFVPTPHEVVAEMLRMVDLKESDILYDLGCGDGRIVIAAVKQYGVKKATGIDIDPERIAESRANAKSAGVSDKVRFIQQDLFEADFSDATVVTLYLLTSVNLRLRPKLLSDLQPGTRVVSHYFEMGDWEPENSSRVSATYDDHGVYFWIIPANITGVWDWTMTGPSESEKITMDVKQRFQQFWGKAEAAGAEFTLMDTRLKGADVEFVLKRDTQDGVSLLTLKGVADGDVIEGTVSVSKTGEASRQPWKAVRRPDTKVSIVE